MAARRSGGSGRRPARRQTSAQLARTRSAVARRNLEELEKVARDALARGIQGFAVRAMNSLAQKGPAWSGEFSASWGFAPEGMTPSTPGTTGQIYRYGKKDVTFNDVSRYLKDGYTRFTIVNTSDHASFATDEEEGVFWRPRSFKTSIKPPVEEGWGRPDDIHFRYQFRRSPRMITDRYDKPVEAYPTSSITAEQDWYTNYLKGGELQNDLNIGFRPFSG